MQQSRSNSSMAFGCLIPLFPVLSCLPLAFSILRGPKKRPKQTWFFICGFTSGYLVSKRYCYSLLLRLTVSFSCLKIEIHRFFFNNLLLQVYACWSCAQGLPKKKKSEKVHVQSSLLHMHRLYRILYRILSADIEHNNSSAALSV